MRYMYAKFLFHKCLASAGFKLDKDVPSSLEDPIQMKKYAGKQQGLLIQ